MKKRAQQKKKIKYDNLDDSKIGQIKEEDSKRKKKHDTLNVNEKEQLRKYWDMERTFYMIALMMEKKHLKKENNKRKRKM